MLLGQSFGFFGLDFRFDLEGFLIVEAIVGRRRQGRDLRCKKRLGGFQRMHLLATFDDEGLRRADRRISDHRQRYLEAGFEIAQMAALVVQHVQRDVGSGAHHHIVGRALHQRFFEIAQQLQRHR